MTEQKIIVIGAGMAGLAAARTLQHSGQAVKLLEARERIGGRTHTDSSLGGDVDLGASWIHGPLGNPVTPLAEQFGLSSSYTDFNNDFGNSTLAFDAHGRQLDTALYTKGANLWRGAISHLFGSILPDPPPETCRSYAQLYEHGLPGVDLASLAPDEQAGYRYAAKIRPAYEDASDLDLIDWRLSENYIKLPGVDLLVHGGGYQKLARGLAEGLDIQTNVIVTEIAYDDSGVRLTTSQGDMRGDRLILTVPLGVLKSGSIRFSPLLPTAKQTVIERMGMGNYEKIALKFPRRFWPLEPQRINYLAEGEESLYNAWLNHAHYSGQPILVAYHAGRRAERINQLEDEALIAGCLSALRTMFGPDVPAPVGYVRSGWQADPFSCGSYSYAKVGSQAGDIRTLAQPVANRLFFAGEATHPHYYGTVHGAYETGVRAAREVRGSW